MEKTFQQRNATNMKELFDLLLKPQPRETYTTREPEEFEREASADVSDREDYEEIR